MPKRVGDYEILDVLGTGGMGRVYKVRNVISDRVEAMKVLLPDLAGHQELADRFLREIKVLAALNHPNIAALRTALTLDNQLVMIMEYVEGTTLAERLERGPVLPADALNYIDQVLGALSYAHGQHVIHRDIKPSNMMLTPQGVVKLMDFGIARSGSDSSLTLTGTTLGSIYYMSPEQVKGEVVDSRSDLYSVGVSLYEMVTGQRPFHAESDFSIMAAHLQQTPKPPIELRSDLPKGLSDIIMTAMAKNPADRFQSADDFRAALHTVAARLALVTPQVQDLPTAATPPADVSIPAQDNLPTASINRLAAAPASAPPQSERLPSVLELSQRQGRHRGLYMSLGALIVVVVLAAAGLYLPRRNKASADVTTGLAGLEKSNHSSSGIASIPPSPGDPVKNTQINSGSSTPSAVAGAIPPSGTNPKTEPAHLSRGGPVVLAGEKNTLSASSDHRLDLGRADQIGPLAGGQAQTDNSQELEELEKQIDQLASRAASVHDSLETLRRQQAAQGLGLRGDIVSSQERMQTYMGKAQAAAGSGDARGSRKYIELAQQEIEKLEKFLGR
ncbi:MAG TPA: protein kinase [Terriglobales bacterium]|nr:protein kinase [Terriglobales bacterium]